MANKIVKVKASVRKGKRVSAHTRLLKKHGLKGFNKPKLLTNDSTHKGIVLAKEGDEVKLLRFGDATMGHNYSPEARKSFKARHAKNIAKGKMSKAYWADKLLWTKGGNKKNPPKSQKIKKGYA
jgi:hypothetical protein